MGRIKSKANQRIGRLFVIENVKERDKNGSVVWLCKCDCGNYVKVSSKDLSIDKKRGVSRVQSCGCLNDETRRKKSKDPKPPKDSYIEVLEEVGYTSQRKVEYKCICKRCGVELLLNKKSINRRKQCDSCNRLDLSNRSFNAIGDKSQNWKGFGDIPKTIFTSIKSGAIYRNKKFDISIEYLDELWKKQKGLCALSNLPICISKKVTDRQTTASLDRIDSSMGYIEGNVQWVHKDLNRMKWGLTMEKFIDYCRMVTNANC